MRHKSTATFRQVGIATAAALLVSTLNASSALAFNPRDLWHRTIPASACAPFDSVQAAKVRLQNGAWRFDGNNTGSVSFFCPIPINAWPADNDEPDYTQMQFYRVWYRDSDGMGLNAKVAVSLRYRDLAGGWLAVAGVLNSNVFADMGFTTKIINCVHEFDTDALYSFYVTISRANALETVEFHGIDFRDGLTPAN